MGNTPKNDRRKSQNSGKKIQISYAYGKIVTFSDAKLPLNAALLHLLMNNGYLKFVENTLIFTVNLRRRFNFIYRQISGMHSIQNAQQLVEHIFNVFDFFPVAIRTALSYFAHRTKTMATLCANVDESSWCVAWFNDFCCQLFESFMEMRVDEQVAAKLCRGKQFSHTTHMKWNSVTGSMCQQFKFDR